MIVVSATSKCREMLKTRIMPCISTVQRHINKLGGCYRTFIDSETVTIVAAGVDQTPDISRLESLCKSNDAL